MGEARSSRRGGDGRRERWRVHREARRAELIEAVLSAVRERGAGIGMEDVVAVSGIAKPVFYRYFTDKADLFLAVGQTVAERMVEEVVLALDGKTSARGRLRAAIDTYLRGIEAEPMVYRFALHPPLERAPRDPIVGYVAVVGQHAARHIGQALRDAGLDETAADPWGFGLVGMVRSAGDRWLEQRSMTREALTDHLTGLLWDGLAHAASPSAPDLRLVDQPPSA